MTRRSTQQSAVINISEFGIAIPRKGPKASDVVWALSDQRKEVLRLREAYLTADREFNARDQREQELEAANAAAIEMTTSQDARVQAAKQVVPEAEARLQAAKAALAKLESRKAAAEQDADLAALMSALGIAQANEAEVEQKLQAAKAGERNLEAKANATDADDSTIEAFMAQIDYVAEVERELVEAKGLVESAKDACDRKAVALNLDALGVQVEQARKAVTNATQLLADAESSQGARIAAEFQLTLDAQLAVEDAKAILAAVPKCEKDIEAAKHRFDKATEFFNGMRKRAREGKRIEPYTLWAPKQARKAVRRAALRREETAQRVALREQEAAAAESTPVVEASEAA